ncbi:DNA ligase I, ATP-dependent Dnl1 [Pseudarthrobacter chlorophenolicus A6]|uniref:Probable DNA ligase n=1 Tax=Pseudarthrobacter chlorophenolicus (strain ATCC 700700 / DSM 12829 / CIP 107037 / JCM 12360 / KCTC 9906 / NCIMB 13794 / A6) TaxID=452863 RepID=DNLI_PSECP|nr:ATP-dependent DNA ligase [Pseudarthrobacter chlorophenolicus]B8HCE1.1 RecName: Full=Probable DNA ligase; AltName: Full=Polydeoxyribonucleotide synthase [ATP] [Pseudarthrobacter chlorophenolicus A6]ACL40557.1 DNA ligase I, ATP-dependent Dnl1 [Pseudarthrobacter chlorophenolicus A6]SDQ79371.1 DNA ligase-1 [Pseudarthrobacter chlorophenolicus]
MLLDELVRTTDAVASTRSRLAKVDALAQLLKRLDPADIPAAVGLLTAKPRQGRVGVGWRGMSAAMGEPAADPGLTLADLDAALDRLQALAGAGSAAERAATLRGLTAAATEREQAFIGGVLLGELRTGALEGVLTDAVARAAERSVEAVRRAAMLSGDLGSTALLALTGTAAELDAVGLKVGRPVQPMLAGTGASVTAALETTGEASVEYKLDGARIQVHRSGGDVRIFTRTLAEVTHRLPEVVEVVRGFPVHDVILDGETLALGEDGAPRPFQETMSRFGADAARTTVLHPWFFDVLHIDGRDLLDEPLSERIKVLEAIAPAHRIPGEITADPEVAGRISRDALAAGHEGVMLKSVGSLYAAGRRGSNWIKVKPVLTYDLVVLACEWGSGRRTGMLSNLHLGALDPAGEYGEPGGYVMVGKTFKGLTDALLQWQTKRFQEIEVRRTAGTVWVEPVTVVEIAIDGVQQSPRYPGRIALRFARVKGYREDKTAAEADTIQTLRALLRP